jgi:peptidoglycan/LPS O-acetylase OafA/YrhL
LTGLRGVAALWVVFFHLFPILGRLFNANLDLPLVRVGYLGVDVFFILSGFILCHVYVSSFREYAVREHIHFLMIRLARIYPLHLLIMLGFVLAVCFARGFAAQETYPRYTVPGFFVAALLLQNWYHEQLIWNAPAWSLSAEWVAYLLFPWLLIATRSIKGAWQAIALATLSLASLALTFAVSGHSINSMGKAGFLRLAAEFTAGALIRRAYGLGLPAKIPWRLMNPIAAFLLAATLYYPRAAPFSVLLFGFMVLSLSEHEGRMEWVLSSKLMIFLGEISYSVYLVQGLLLALATWHINTYTPADMRNRWTFATVLITSLLLVPILTWWAVERPARTLGRRLSDRFRYQVTTTPATGQPATSTMRSE